MPRSALIMLQLCKDADHPPTLSLPPSAVLACAEQPQLDPRWVVAAEG